MEKKQSKVGTIKGFTKSQLHSAMNRVLARGNKSIRKGGFNALVSEVKNPGKANIRCAKVAIRHFMGLRAQAIVSSDGQKVLFIGA